MTVLATTALEWTWGGRGRVVFLGEWCRRYERTARWQAREHLVVRNHWDDRAKLQRDYRYLQALHDELLRDLIQLLGQFHRLERSSRYWQTLLDPWLARYLGVAFDRWESVRIAFEEYEVSETFIREPRFPRPPRDHLHFIRLCNDDDWNHDFYADILQHEYAPRCRMYSCPEAAAQLAAVPPVSLARQLRALLLRSAVRADSLVGRLTRNNDFAFIDSYFPAAAVCALSLKLGEIPRLLFGEFAWPDPEVHPAVERKEEVRRSLTLTRTPANRFEVFLQARIKRDLLQVHVEGLDALRARAHKIALRPRFVLTANAHWFNDLFKQWIAERVDTEGVRLVAMDHGNGIPPRFGTMGFEEDISDIRATWPMPFHSKHVRLPPSKLVGIRGRRKAGQRLLIIGSELPRYAFAVSSTPIADQALVAYDFVCCLHDSLEDAPKRAFSVKPYPNLGWCTRDRFVARLGAQKVCSEPRINRAMRSARMIVCTYPQTTFSEAMRSGVPSLLVYPKDLWETVERFDGLIEALRRAKIVFFDARAAADHINLVWCNPRGWWDSAECVAARGRFEAEALDMRRDWLRPWVEFLGKLRSGEKSRHAGTPREQPRGGGAT